MVCYNSKMTYKVCKFLFSSGADVILIHRKERVTVRHKGSSWKLQRLWRNGRVERTGNLITD